MFLLVCSLLPSFTSAAVTYTVSGISSGGYMTGQLHVSHSASITGVGIVAAGPYYCALNSIDRANTICTYSNIPLDITPMVTYATTMSATGQIDPVVNMKNDKVFIFGGAVDELMNPPIVQGTYDFYKNFVPTSQITFVNSIKANHAWPTNDKGNPCWYYGMYFVNNCGFDGAGIILNTILGNLFQKVEMNSTHLFKFSQSKYTNVQKASMDSTGYIYVPAGCQPDASQCRLHVNIHGCFQNYMSVGLNYIIQVGVAEWAESNNIVVIFPQTASTDANNKWGCWDLVGYTGSNYAIKSAIQITAIHAIAMDYVGLVASLFK